MSIIHILIIFSHSYITRSQVFNTSSHFYTDQVKRERSTCKMFPFSSWQKQDLQRLISNSNFSSFLLSTYREVQDQTGRRNAWGSLERREPGTNTLPPPPQDLLLPQGNLQLWAPRENSRVLQIRACQFFEKFIEIEFRKKSSGQIVDFCATNSTPPSVFTFFVAKLHIFCLKNPMAKRRVKKNCHQLQFFLNSK